MLDKVSDITASFANDGVTLEVELSYARGSTSIVEASP